MRWFHLKGEISIAFCYKLLLTKRSVLCIIKNKEIKNEVVGMSTVREIAQMTGLSTATVSRALRGSATVTDKTRQAVLLAKQKLDSMENSDNKLIGLVLTDAGNPFYDDAIRMIEKELRASGYQLLCSISNDMAITENALRMMCCQGVSALIWLHPTTMGSGDAVREIQEAGIPLVQVFNNCYPDVDSVIIDDSLGCYLITKALIQQYGHERILYVGNCSSRHYQGYLRAHHGAGLQPVSTQTQFIPDGRNQVDFIVEAIKHCQPTAIISHTQFNTIGTLRACRALRLSIPEDISLVAYDDFPWLAMMEISAIVHPLEELAKSVCQVLKLRLDLSDKGNQTTATVHLVTEPFPILRDSVRANRK